MINRLPFRFEDLKINKPGFVLVNNRREVGFDISHQSNLILWDRSPIWNIVKVLIYERKIFGLVRNSAEKSCLNADAERYLWIHRNWKLSNVFSIHICKPIQGDNIKWTSSFIRIYYLRPSLTSKDTPMSLWWWGTQKGN